MHDNFYSTTAQVIPVLLLALLWESPYLERLRRENRPSRAAGRGFFWTKARVRVFLLVVAGIVMLTLLLNLLILAGWLPDSGILRGLVMFGLVAALGTLSFRICVDVMDATAVTHSTSSSDAVTPSPETAD